VVAVLSAVAVLAVVVGADAGPSFTVTSTLDGKKVLPHRIHWVVGARDASRRAFQGVFQDARPSDRLHARV
jgi:hypothetical protein